MAKKRGNDDYDMSYEILQDGGGMPMNTLFGDIVPRIDDNYKEIDVERTQVELQTKAQNLVDSICEVYYKIGDNSDLEPEIQQYLAGAKTLEVMNLQSLMLQVKTSDHLLYSLLNRLNATGSVDSSLYRLITETQEKSLQMTLMVSNYIRMMPGYFKQLKFELQTNVEMISVERTQEMIELKDETTDDDFIRKPQKGMRSLLKQVEEYEKNLNDEGETVEDNVDLPKPPDLLRNEVNDEEDELRKQLIADNQ